MIKISLRDPIPTAVHLHVKLWSLHSVSRSYIQKHPNEMKTSEPGSTKS